MNIFLSFNLILLSKYTYVNGFDKRTNKSTKEQKILALGEEKTRRGRYEKFMCFIVDFSDKLCYTVSTLRE